MKKNDGVASRRLTVMTTREEEEGGGGQEEEEGEGEGKEWMDIKIGI